MRKTTLFLILTQYSLFSFSQIIADHTVVDLYDDIPQYYIDEVKKMLLIPAGESHSGAYMAGLVLLEQLDSKYQVDTGDGVDGPDSYTDKKLRAERVFWGDFDNPTEWVNMYGEEDWWTNSTAISGTKAGITYMNDNGFQISAIGFGWCWDMYGDMSSSIDPVYGVHWWGVSLNGPDGTKPWGLDADDYNTTGNSLSLDSYLSATQEYADYCTEKGYSTKVFYTTGPTNGESGEVEYQVYLKHEHIREYVRDSEARILFDYADILAYNDDGTTENITWNDHTFPIITQANFLPEETGHISNAGALRLGKALWWMLARIAGWDGGGEEVSIEKAEVSKFTIFQSSDNLNIKLDPKFIDAKYCSVYTRNGKLLHKEKVISNPIGIPISSFSSGVYIISLSGTELVTSTKVVIP